MCEPCGWFARAHSIRVSIFGGRALRARIVVYNVYQMNTYFFVLEWIFN